MFETVKTATPEWHTKPIHKNMLFADKYAITAWFALFCAGLHERQTVFTMYIRKHSQGGEFTVAAGQEIYTKWLENWRDVGFDNGDLAYINLELIAAKVDPKMRMKFITYLQKTDMSLTVDMLQEGDLINPDQPYARLTGFVGQCLYAEGSGLNIFNSQSALATRAAHFRLAAGDDFVFDGCLRRAQELGGVFTSRALYVGGIDGTSNMAAGRMFGIPCKGSMMHAYVMFHTTRGETCAESELRAFRNYAKAFPHNSLFLPDTYELKQGVENAIKACELEGVEFLGARNDSGNLNAQADKMQTIFDETGKKGLINMASSDLYPEMITRMKLEGTKVNSWLVGTKAVDIPPLGGVYKIGVVADAEVTDVLESFSSAAPRFIEVIKLSGDAIKVTIPGILETLRFVDEDGMFVADAIVDTRIGIEEGILKRNINVVNKTTGSMHTFYKGTTVKKLLKPVFKEGAYVGNVLTTHQAKDNTANNLQSLAECHKRLEVIADDGETVLVEAPYPYFAGIESGLYARRAKMIGAASVA